MVMSAQRGNGEVLLAALDDEHLLFFDVPREHRASVKVRLGHPQRQVRQILIHGGDLKSALRRQTGEATSLDLLL